MKLLLFGRKGDSLTSACIDYLTSSGFKVDFILSEFRDEKLPTQCFDQVYDYIICYRSYFLLPKQLLDRTRLFNINFHPGPPKYPGSGGINLALLNDDDHFGVTAHLMNEKIDAGPIIKNKNFIIGPASIFSFIK